MQRLTSKLQKIQIRFNNISPFQGSGFCFGPVPPVAPGVIHIQPLCGLKQLPNLSDVMTDLRIVAS